MSTVIIPSSVEDAVESLNGLGALLTATEWQRAAIVAAFVTKGAGTGGKPTTSSGFSIALAV